MGIYKFFKKLLFIYRASNPHFLYVDFTTYTKYKWLIKLIVSLNPNYTNCEIFRREFKYLKNFVVIGLKWNGKTVKRRTSGFAKTFIKGVKNATCVYCEQKLTDDNATSDHILPISKKGNNCQVNLVICCRKCNCDRGNMDFDKFLRMKNKKYGSIKYLFV